MAAVSLPNYTPAWLEGKEKITAGLLANNLKSCSEADIQALWRWAQKQHCQEHWKNVAKACTGIRMAREMHPKLSINTSELLRVMTTAFAALYKKIALEDKRVDQNAHSTVKSCVNEIGDEHPKHLGSHSLFNFCYDWNRKQATSKVIAKITIPLKEAIAEHSINDTAPKSAAGYHLENDDVYQGFILKPRALRSSASGSPAFSGHYYGVLDGGQDDFAINYLKRNFLEILNRSIAIENDESEISIYNALSLAFVDAHYHLINNTCNQSNAGSSFCFALIREGVLYIANVGDTSAVLIINNNMYELSTQAIPGKNPRLDFAAEMRGAKIIDHQLVMPPDELESLSVTSGLGYQHFDGFCSRPAICRVDLKQIPKEQDYTLILGTCNIWQDMNHDNLIKISKLDDAKEAAEMLCQHKSNRTAVVVKMNKT